MSWRDQLARHAFEDQRHLALPWFNMMSELIGQCASKNSISQQRGGPYAIRSGDMVKLQLEEMFKQLWAKVLDESSKLKFYSQVKEVPSFEAYLRIPSRDIRKSVARLRSSSHRLNIETARYSRTTRNLSKKNFNVDNYAWLKCCKMCCDDNVAAIQHLPFAPEPIIEDEHHILVTCPAYHHLRAGASDYVLSSLLAWDERLPTLFEVPHINDFASFIHKIFLARFPKKKDNKC